MRQMSLAEAIRIVRGARFSPTRRVAVVCSFESLHFKTFLQAYLAETHSQHSEGVPEVVSFGYDQLRAGLKSSASGLAQQPAFLFLDWADIHPSLSWRARGQLCCSAAEIATGADALAESIAEWSHSRTAQVSYLLLPSESSLPFLDPQSLRFRGAVRAAAVLALAQVVSAAVAAGVRVLEERPAELDFRNLTQAGCPLSTADAERMARAAVEVLCWPAERLKAIVVDLDNTLWKGIIGEDGADKLRCGADAEGYPFLIWQKLLKRLGSEGILLAFCSKNNEADVLPVFDSLDFPLKLPDFAAYRCNWASKARNVRGIVEELNIGLESVLFVDDNSAELLQVSAELPEIRTRRTPSSGAEWLQLFREIHDLCGTSVIADEDTLRTRSIQQNRLRQSFNAPIDGFGHLKELGLQIKINRDAFSLPRSLELINKTNQFNLTGRRLSEADWASLAARLGAFCWAVSLADRFGDFGVIAVIVGNVDGHAVRLEQFVLSCRAFGRAVEHLILIELERALAAQTLEGPYAATGKNLPARQFLDSMHASWTGESSWTISRDAIYELAAPVVEQAGIEIVSLATAAG